MKDQVQIIYCSSLISERMMEYLFETSKQVPMLSAFKFHKLFVEGFSINNCMVWTISSIPVIQASNNKRFWFRKRENENGVNYSYPPFINITFIKHMMVFIFGFFFALKLIIKSKFQSYLVIDVLDSSISAAALSAAKLTGIKTIGIVTDLPQMLKQTLNISKLSILERTSYKLIQRLINYYDGYVLLTEQMNKLINIRNKPYCVIEGLVDIKMNGIELNDIKKSPRVILYSGGLYEQYGVRNLIEAFILLTTPDIQLSLYGNGEMTSEITDYSKRDKRIKYFGVVQNDKVVKAQSEATLLVNPRPSKGEYTKYSFPSKNMEYMASGTPVITTRLPGMPIEYYDYVFFFDDETVKGFSKTLNEILSMPEKVLYEKGQKGKAFVMEKKNNKIQAEKILALLKSL
jgi:glycosyltransferase involved in cell wall biosynthesis